MISIWNFDLHCLVDLRILMFSIPIIGTIRKASGKVFQKMDDR